MSKSYDKFAPYYDKFMSFMDYEERVAALDCYLKKIKVIDKTILDLGAGSGAYLIPLTRCGYKVDGLDMSQQMLSNLRAKLNKEDIDAQLFNEDMSSFELDIKYGTIICLGDSIHHLPSYDQILGMLKCCRKHLIHGGRLIFDYREPEYFEQLVEMREFYEDHGDDYMLWSSQYVDDDNVMVNLNAFICGAHSRYDKISEQHHMFILDHDILMNLFNDAGLIVEDELFGSFWTEDDSSEYKHTFILAAK